MYHSFQDSGTNFIQIGTEEISYTGISGNELTGVTRGVEEHNSCTQVQEQQLQIQQICCMG